VASLASLGGGHVASLASLGSIGGGQENMAVYFDGQKGTMLTYEGAGARIAATVSGGITVEAWVLDTYLAER
jgi:hypothetical protein